MVEVAQCIADESCTLYTSEDFSSKMANSLTLIGGLVSALVIAELAVTEPGKLPLARMIKDDERIKKIVATVIAGLYITAWVGFGLYAYLHDYLFIESDVLPAIADLGQGWLGIAVGAGYAYFGIKKTE